MTKELWTMISKNRMVWHLATITFVGLCGRDNLMVRDYVEFQDGKINRIGESKQVLETIPEHQICKQCLKMLKKEN